MAIDSRRLLDRLEEMAFEEQRAIRAEVDAAFFKPGWSSSPILISASAAAIAAGLRRATARIADEAWAAAEKKDPVFTADAGQVATHLRIRMVSYYRQRLMSDRGGWSPEVIVKACADLSETLRDICDKMVDQLARRSRPLPPALLLDLSCLAAGRGAADPESTACTRGARSPSDYLRGAPVTAAAVPTAPITAEPVPAAPVTAHPCTSWPRNGCLRSTHHRTAGPGGTCFRGTRHRAVHHRSTCPRSTCARSAPPCSGSPRSARCRGARHRSASLRSGCHVNASRRSASSRSTRPCSACPRSVRPRGTCSRGTRRRSARPLGAPEVPGPASSAGEGASPTPAGPILVGPVEMPPKRPPPHQSIDLARLPTLLSEVRDSLGGVWIDRARRQALLREIAAIEAFLQRENPHRGMLLRMVRRLPPALKMVRLDKAARSVESVI